MAPVINHELFLTIRILVQEIIDLCELATRRLEMVIETLERLPVFRMIVSVSTTLTNMVRQMNELKTRAETLRRKLDNVSDDSEDSDQDVL